MKIGNKGLKETQRHTIIKIAFSTLFQAVIGQRIFGLTCEWSSLVESMSVRMYNDASSI